MSNSYFRFRQFIVHQEACSMKVTTDSCLFGAWAADRISKMQGVKNILDIGTGTGLLSLMLAQKTTAQITGIEIQEKDYLQACQNIALSPWHDRISMHHADAAQFQPSHKFDVIISNPPFFENSLRSDQAHKNIAHHDTSLTLKTLLHLIRQWLTPQGRFYLLLPAQRREAFTTGCHDVQMGIHHIVNVHQTERHAPFRIMAEGQAAPLIPTKDASIYIKNKEEYSTDFMALLKDYYLYL
ncbi:MAG: methyltransferase [Niabella sp.]